MFGMNLPGCTYYTSGPALIDRMRMGGDPDPKAPKIYDQSTFLPVSAGSVSRVVPIDPGTHDYVFLFDGAVTGLFINGAIKPPVIVGNRATFTAKRPDVNFASQMTVNASGPVKSLSLVRADHEEAFLKGELFNPDLVSALIGIKTKSIRALDFHATNNPTYPARRPSMIDVVFQDSRGGLPHEIGAMLANKIGSSLWSTLHHMMSPSQQGEALHEMDAVAGGSSVYLEWSNEFGWNYQKSYASTQTQAKYGLTKASSLDILRYYGFMAGTMANLAATVSKRFKVNLSAQPSATPDKSLAAILAGWDESKAPRSLISGFANGGYLNFNYPTDTFTKLLLLQQSNDVEGYYTLAQSMVPVLAARHQAAAKACAAEGIPYKVYEFNSSIYGQAPNIVDATKRAAFLAWIEPLVYSDRMAEIVVQAGKSAIDAGAVEANFYQLSGAGSQYGFWGAMPHTSQPVYPVYNRLASANQNTDLAMLASEISSMRVQLDDLAARVAAAI